MASRYKAGNPEEKDSPGLSRLVVQMKWNSTSTQGHCSAADTDQLLIGQHTRL